MINFKLLMLFFIVPLIFLMTSSSFESNFYESYNIFPGEFEKHDSIWLAWSNEKYRAGESTGKVVVRMIKELQPYVKINLLVKNETVIEKIKEILRKRNINDNHINYIIIPEYNRWMRDSGPVFVKDNQLNLKIIDFKFNFYGLLESDDPESISIDNEDKIIAEKLDVELINTDIYSEGGNREFNGKGTMIAVKSVELSRNPDKSLKELEENYKNLFGIRKIIWLKKGLAADDSYYHGPITDNIYSSSITDGHIDEFCRFVSHDTILLAEVTKDEAKKDPIYRETYKRLEENYQILKNSTDQDGNPFKIIRIPAASNIIIKDFIAEEKILKINYVSTEENNISDDSVKYIISASYLNFLATNSVVLMPKYWKDDRSYEIKIKDENAKKILESAFPDRKVIQIDAEPLNHGGGGIHCITQQQPAL
ncbi:MAG: agmatine deiminase family protein [Spirochaetes bacterium]|nr:agmatine deiminase family protein [Spirochaetota bacterium]